MSTMVLLLLLLHHQQQKQKPKTVKITIIFGMRASLVKRTQNDHFVIMVEHVPYFIEQAKIKIGRQKSLPCVDHVSIGLDGEWFVRLEEGDWRCKWSI